MNFSKKRIAIIVAVLLISIVGAPSFAPGQMAVPNLPQATFGSMMPHLTGNERELFRGGREAFVRRTSVQGDSYVPNTEIGLGPRFNGDSCAMCHAYPTIGGSSPARNPQIECAAREGARNVIPSFIRADGPVRQARLQADEDGNLDGSVYPVFTINGRRDAQGCNLPQADFEHELNKDNVSFRIPPPLFGAGLIEAISDSEIESNAQRELDKKRKLGIEGHPNRMRSDGSIGRFGWKAHVSSLEAFAAEAYAVEQGVTNELFPHERKGTPSECLFNPTPEDRFSPFFSRPVEAISNVSRVAYFVRFLQQPPLARNSEEANLGRRFFVGVGCAYCHTPMLITGRSSHSVLSEQPVALFSDLLVHHMGSELADGVQQGDAGPDEFRTAPLWGLNKRLFFLHDGRTNDLNEAVLMHSSESSSGRPSEAREVVARYRQLTQQEKDALLIFLKTL